MAKINIHGASDTPNNYHTRVVLRLQQQRQSSCTRHCSRELTPRDDTPTVALHPSPRRRTLLAAQLRSTAGVTSQATMGMSHA
eukprot:scaffold6691_cov358-Prasinococcus_capsulatus_cf.AAC.9